MKSEELLSQAIEECRIHKKRIEYAKNKLGNTFPMGIEKWNCLSEEEIEAMDQLVFRFIKLQDALGLRVFTQVLVLLQEPVENKSMLDKLNRLEKLEIIKSARKWQELRNLRNNLTHEYPNQDVENCERFNYFFKEVDSLIGIFQMVVTWLSEKGFM